MYQALTQVQEMQECWVQESVLKELVLDGHCYSARSLQTRHEQGI